MIRAERNVEQTGRRRVGAAEYDAFTSKLVYIGSLDQFLTLVAKVRGHIVDHDPHNVRALAGSPVERGRYGP